MRKNFKLTASSESISQFRVLLKDLLVEAGLNQKKTREMLLAIQEVLTNIFRHAYGGQPGQIKICLVTSKDDVCLTVQDKGKSYDWTRTADPKLPPTQPGGLGIYFIKKSVDKIQYENCGCEKGNRIHLIKYKYNVKEAPHENTTKGQRPRGESRTQRRS